MKRKLKNGASAALVGIAGAVTVLLLLFLIGYILLRGLPADADEAAGYAAGKISFGGNIRGSEEYRRQICRVLVRRAIRQLEEVQPCR